MEKHSEFAKIQYFANLHKDSVLGIKYLANNQTGKIGCNCLRNIIDYLNLFHFQSCIAYKQILVLLA
jgi:hypothetical protein